MHRNWIGDRSTESVRNLEIFLDKFLGASNWCVTVCHADGTRIHIASSGSTEDLRAAHDAFRQAKSEDMDRDLVDRPNAAADEESRVLNLAAPLGCSRRCFFSIAWDSARGFARWKDDERRLADTLCALLQAALARRYEECLERALRTAIQRLDLGCVIATTGGEVLFANAAALALCEGRRRGGDAGDNAAALSRYVKSLVHGEPARSRGVEPRVHPLRLRGGGICPAYVAPISIDDSIDGDKRWGFVIFMSRQEPLADPIALEVALGLTRKEAMLTLEIAQGRSIAEAAKLLSVREQTARSYLKRIYSKLAVNRQSQLAAVASRLSVPLRGNAAKRRL